MTTTTKKKLRLDRRALWRHQELAAAMGIDRSTLRKLRDAGAVPQTILIGNTEFYRVGELRDWIAAGAPPALEWAWQPARRFTLEQHVKRSIAELARLQGQARDAQNELADIERRISKGNQATEALDHQRRKLAVLDRR